MNYGLFRDWSASDSHLICENMQNINVRVNAREGGLRRGWSDGAGGCAACACCPSANQSAQHEHRLRSSRASGTAACSGAATAAGARRAGLAIGRVHVA